MQGMETNEKLSPNPEVRVEILKEDGTQKRKLWKFSNIRKSYL